MSALLTLLAKEHQLVERFPGNEAYQRLKRLLTQVADATEAREVAKAALANLIPRIASAMEAGDSALVKVLRREQADVEDRHTDALKLMDQLGPYVDRATAAAIDAWCGCYVGVFGEFDARTNGKADAVAMFHRAIMPDIRKAAGVDP